MRKHEINIVIAGGGTGGHLFPGISIAQAFLKADSGCRILFAGTDRPFEKKVLKNAGFEHKSIRISGLKGMGFLNKIKTALMLPFAIVQAIFILIGFKADLIVGVGGYSSGPVAVAAWLLRKKVILHEQNIIPGITNRILSRFASRIYVSFAETADHFSMATVKTTGNPVRNEILGVKREKQATDKAFTILISGGSQGAHAINQAICDALNYIDPHDSFHFIHQTGENDVQMMKDAYTRQGISHKVQPFFNDMEIQYEKADLIICRAGATSIAEITAMGHSSILIPFPYAADNHQVKNAEVLVKKRAAEMITEDHLNGTQIAQRIVFYANDSEKLKQMAENSKKYGRPKAAETLVNDCYKLLKEN